MPPYAEGELLGDQRPRILHLPSTVQSRLTDGLHLIDGTLGREAVDLAAHAGLFLDEWQQWLLEILCATSDETFWNPITERYENKWVAFESGICVPRQNGKGGFLEARELAGLFLWGEKEMVHSAHEFNTARKHFERISQLIESTPDLDREVFQMHRGHGDESIVTKSGCTLVFRTRTKAGGRGMTGDLLVLDEAMILKAAFMRALKPILAARPNVQIIYTGSVGDEDSEQFGSIRERGLLDEDPDLMYAEWSIDACNPFCPPGCTEHDAYDDPHSWAKANPAMGVRISMSFLRKSWNGAKHVDPEGFAAEHLGVGTWPTSDTGWKVFNKDYFDSRAREDSVLQGDFALAADTSPERSMSAIAAVGKNQDGLIHLEITSEDVTSEDGEVCTRYDYRPGYQWLAPRIIDIWKRDRDNGKHCKFVVIDPTSQAATIIPELEQAGIPVHSPNSREYAQACGDVLSSIQPRNGEVATAVHLNQAPLKTAAASAVKRALEGIWAWSKSKSSSDISPLVAVTCAWIGWKKHETEPEAAEPWAYWGD